MLCFIEILKIGILANKSISEIGKFSDLPALTLSLNYGLRVDIVVFLILKTST